MNEIMQEVENKHKFQLVVYEGDFSLPSIEPECIKSMLYCAVAGVPLDIRFCNTFKTCLLYRAPSFVHGNLRSSKSFKDIVMYLKTINYDLDRKFNPIHTSETLALSVLVRSKLKPMLEFSYWIEPRNSNELMRLWFMRSLPWPFNHIHASRFKQRAKDLMDALYPNEDDCEVVKSYMQRAAMDCLSNLSTRLGTRDYFYGQQPHTLDVIVYAYLAPFLKAPLPLNEMSTLINMWPNLINFVKRIDSTYFPDIPQGSKYIKLEEKEKLNDDEVSYIAVVILALSATTLVLGFAYSRGFLTGKIPY